MNMKGMKLLLCIIMAMVSVCNTENNKSYFMALKEFTNPQKNYLLFEKNKEFEVEEKNSPLKTVQEIWFMNEVEQCRDRYPEVEKKVFYKYLYCDLINKKYKTEAGGICNMSEKLVKNVEDRLFDFVIFKGISLNCEKKLNYLMKRTVMNSELLNDGKQYPKVSDLKNIYLGISKFPMTTFVFNK